MSLLSDLLSQIRCDAILFEGLDSDRQETWSALTIPADDNAADDGFAQAHWKHYWACQPCNYPDRTGDLERGSASTRWRDFGDIFVMTGRRSFRAGAVRQALQTVADHRQVELASLDEALDGYAEIGQPQQRQAAESRISRYMRRSWPASYSDHRADRRIRIGKPQAASIKECDVGRYWPWAADSAR